MPLDPSIFFRGAELQARNAAQTQATIGNFFDKLAATKERKLAEEKARATDYEGSAYRVLEALQAGREPDPADIPRALTWDKMNQAQNAVNPSTGEPFPKNASIFGSLQNAGGAQYPPGGFSAPPSFPADAISIVPQGQGAPMGGLPMGENRPYANDLGGDMLPPVGDNYADVAGMPMAQRDMARGLPAPANAKQGLANYEAQLDIAKQEAEADIKASQAGAEKRATMTQEAQVNAEDRKKALTDIQTGLNSLLKDAEGTPSGLIEGAAATLSSAVGYPNEKALKRARFESGKAISGLQSRISFLKGQGTITDAEAAQAMAFIPEPNDPYQIKVEKLQGGIDYINGIISGGQATPSAQGKPGFRYLGTE